MTGTGSLTTAYRDGRGVDTGIVHAWFARELDARPAGGVIRT